MSTDYIDLNRTFRKLPERIAETDEFDFESVLGFGKGLAWGDLLTKRRVILLSEAGTGKTQEIRHSAQHEHRSGNLSFFLRLEHVADDFDIAFENVAGSRSDFEDWLKSKEEARIFLDSVDEARLKSPMEFARAIRKIGAMAKPALHRARIVISSRGSAWKPISDLQLCNDHLTFKMPREEEEQRGAGSNGNLPNVDRNRAPLISDEMENGEGVNQHFEVFKLDDLSGSQVQQFAEAKGVKDAEAFLDAIERADAWLLTHRPQDLEELISFWLTNDRIGNRREIMEESIAFRLTERDHKREEVSTLTSERALEGAELLAAAATLTQQSAINVPDGAKSQSGLSPSDFLTQWIPADIQTLLGRPLFDEALYGSVRFHHRSQREYLCAKWFHKLLQRQTSRRAIEAILFKEQYGLVVIPPTLRPVLAWLILFDGRVRERALSIAPELIFEGGEPAALPLETRTRILHQVCNKIAKGDTAHTPVDYSAIQRFADAGLSDEIRRLIAKYPKNEDIVWFLLRMVWQGQIEKLLPEAIFYASKRQVGRHVQIAAIRAVIAVGSDEDVRGLRAKLLKTKELKRDVLAELVARLPPDREGIDWLIKALGKTRKKERYSSDGVGRALTDYLAALPSSEHAYLLAGLAALLRKKPIVERRYFEVSDKHGWLLKPAAKLIERMIDERHPACLGQDSLFVLFNLPSVSDHGDWELRDIKSEIPKVLPQWSELNDALFWHSVAVARRHKKRKNGRRTTSHIDAMIWPTFCRFVPEDFDRVVQYIGSQPLRDDRLVALSLAFSLYVERGRPRKWRDQLKRATKGKPSLKEKLNSLLHPPRMSEQARSYLRQEARWKRRDKERTELEESNKREWREALAASPDKLRNPGLRSPHQISTWQWHVHERMRDLDGDTSKWSTGNWRVLIKEFGTNVAEAFRDGVVAYWRHNSPRVVSDGKVRNETPHTTIFGLTGVNIEAAEERNWASKLSRDEVEVATRYAFNELNGFPDWFEGLYRHHPKWVSDLATTEVRYELTKTPSKSDSHYFLSDLNWSGQFLDRSLANPILEHLSSSEPRNLSLLEQALNIVVREAHSAKDLGEIAAKKSTLRSLDHSAIWFAIWVGVDPEAAIPALADRIQAIRRRHDRVRFAMLFVTRLVGGRHEKALASQAYRTAKYLHSLIILMHQSIEEKDDIRRSGTGAYTPGLRDEAQDARSRLFSMLKELPGKEAFLAIQSLSTCHPEDASRPWMRKHAQSKAEAEADLEAWTPKQVTSFEAEQERVPGNHRQLAELALLRFEDLKADLENGDSSIASILATVKSETEMRKFIGGWLRDTARGRYTVPQEEEYADAKRADIRFHGIGFDNPVPTELKLADNGWSGSKLFERLENQLCGDYLRDQRSCRGLFVLVYRGEKATWQVPRSGEKVNFSELVESLQGYWLEISPRYPDVEDIQVVGIDLTKRYDRKEK
ncbi:hypothetical protein K3163_02295 [Qipengyuania sp. 1NDW9]|uniref:hypothetical protein n=1 Tax=Qipengyuania xiapuensis TaxID=2867236 RepID=UPI001C875ED9|nr:hypothetical protein [Qipengyuania xiapuensis]MBX7492035.1 hypothetical protein [Qipengyuania xiapuensis]